MTKLSRRTFLKMAGVSATAVTLAGSGCAPRATPEDPAVTSAEEKWVPNVCRLCPAGCGILVRVVDGRAVKIEGNPFNSNNRGKICPKGCAGVQFLYNPDRVKGPMRRVGERGAGEWEAISWDEAIAMVVERLREIRDQGQPHTLVFMADGNRGQMNGLIGRFCQAFGTPNHVELDAIAADGTRQAHRLMQGDYAGYDWNNTKYLLSFGGSFLEAWQPTVRLLAAYGSMRRGRPDVRAKIVQVESRLSVTAAKADEWIPIEPGTEGALALGLAHVLIAERLYDREFVAHYTFGFEDWTDEQGQEHIGFKSLVLRDYAPERVAEITGVPTGTIKRLAREFGSVRPAVAAGERGIGLETNAIFSRMAIHALNALVGSIDVPGGAVKGHDPPLTPWPEVAPDDIAAAGLTKPRLDYAGTTKYPLAESVYQHLPESIIHAAPYEVKVLFLYYADPLYSSPDLSRFYEALARVPFIVSFSPFVDDSTAYADLILPDHTYLERWQMSTTEAGPGYPVLALGQPVVEPLYDTQNTGDVLLRIAHEMGGALADALPWADYQELLQFRSEGLFEARRGSIVTDSFADFWARLQESGAWIDPPYRFGEWKGTFATPSGSFEFYSQTLKRKLEAIVERETEQEMERVLQGLGIAARGDELFMPHYEPPRSVGDESEYPFLLQPYISLALAEGQVANLPWLQEMWGLHLREAWDGWVEINPKTAAELGIADGDLVWVESPVGRIKTRARFYPGAMPGVVNMPVGEGHTAYGRWAKDRGANPNEIIANEYDYLGGLAARLATRVKVMLGNW